MITRKELLTINHYPGYKISDVLGYVKGATVQTKNIGRDIGASLKSIVGGEIRGYSDMMESARKLATERLLKEADDLGADAVLGFKIQTSGVMAGAAEIIAYGTAVKLTKDV